MLFMNYHGVVFALLTFEKSLKFSNAIYHYSAITTFIVFLFLKFSGIVSKAKKLEKIREQKKEKKE